MLSSKHFIFLLLCETPILFFCFNNVENVRNAGFINLSGCYHRQTLEVTRATNIPSLLGSIILRRTTAEIAGTRMIVLRISSFLSFYGIVFLMSTFDGPVVVGLNPKTTFCPVRSLSNELVFIEDRPTSSMFGLTKTECAAKCRFISEDSCRCFNYNSSSMNCSLFNFEPTQYDVDPGGTTVAFQV